MISVEGDEGSSFVVTIKRCWKGGSGGWPALIPDSYTWGRNRRVQVPQFLKAHPVDFPQQGWMWEQGPDPDGELPSVCCRGAADCSDGKAAVPS